MPSMTPAAQDYEAAKAAIHAAQIAVPEPPLPLATILGCRTILTRSVSDSRDVIVRSGEYTR